MRVELETPSTHHKVAAVMVATDSIRAMFGRCSAMPANRLAALWHQQCELRTARERCHRDLQLLAAGDLGVGPAPIGAAMNVA